MSTSEAIARHTLEILRSAEQRHTIYLPTHDPESINRLSSRDALTFQRGAD